MVNFPTELSKIAALLRNDQIDLLSYINQICDRIDALDTQIQALLPETDRRARILREAGGLKARFADPATRPPLYGIPIGIKDIFSVDGFPTRAGSQIPPELFIVPEATCVTTLRAAGALILGKTVTTEFAYFEPGPTRNPLNPAHTPGGSSSGSAAAVSGGFCPLALGTQTIGSVIRPAAFCGIIGFKPSLGRIPTSGVIPFSQSADHVGLFTQDVAGMILAASILCLDWNKESKNSKSAALPVLGVPVGPYLNQASSEALAIFRNQLAGLEDAGYQVRQLEALNDIEAINSRHKQMIAKEMAQVHARWFAQHELLYRPRTAGLIREGQRVGAEELANALAGREELRAQLERLMKQGGIDLWVSPSATGPAPEGIGSTGDPAMNLPWTHAGLPVITIPAGLARNGLPMGMQFVAPFGADERLLHWAEPLSENVTKF